MFKTGDVAPSGALGIQVIRKDIWVPDAVRHFNPHSEFGQFVKSIVKYLPTEQGIELIDRLRSIVVTESTLRAQVFRAATATWENHGVLSRKVVTTAGVQYIVDGFQGLTDISNFRYHGVGTDDTPGAAVGDTGLQLELNTEYNPDATRATGSREEGSGANIYRTIGTVTVDSAAALVEHGVFSQITRNTPTLLDRHTFAVINLANGDAIRTTYDLTLTAGG